MSIRTILVDDEELSASYPARVSGEEDDVQIVAECANGFDAVKRIAEYQPDLLFLDVQMPKLDGFEVLELIDNEVAVVFVTAYDQYATKAFDASAVDYLLKPFDLERFKASLQRVRERLNAKTWRHHPNVSELQEPLHRQGSIYKESSYDGTSLHVVLVGQLEYVEAQDNYVALHARGKTHLKHETISNLEAHWTQIALSEHIVPSL